MPRRQDRYRMVGLGLGLWSAAVSLGLIWLGARDGRPGAPGDPPGRWPTDSMLSLDSTRPTLLLFFDPRCPCSAASLSALEWLATRCGPTLAIWAVGCEPAGSSVPALSSVRVVASGVSGEARRFGVETSGESLLFAPGGRLIFHGGITPGRGRRGSSYGRDAILAAVRGVPMRVASAPVFGCALKSTADER